MRSRASTTIQSTELTSTFDVIYGLMAGDQIDLSNFLGGITLAVTNTNLAGIDNTIAFARGSYDATAGVFTYSATGTDSVMTYDTGAGAATAFESIVLVGFVSTAATAVVPGLIPTGIVGLA